jgi:hypothetical protein
MGDKNPQHTFLSDGKVPCRKILRHVKELLKSHGDEETKLSFLLSFAHLLLLQRSLVVKSGVSPSRSRLLTRSNSPLHSPHLSLD